MLQNSKILTKQKMLYKLIHHKKEILFQNLKNMQKNMFQNL